MLYERPGAARLALWPFSALYCVGWRAYEGLYRLGVLSPREPHRPVVCVGNLRVGGTGKTPVTLHVAEVLKALGREVVVSCSGYRGRRSAGASLSPPGPLHAPTWGDEPAMIRMLAPHLPLVVGRDRVQAARLCAASYPDSVLLLDDGFQHLPLRKHVTIVLESAGPNPFCLPLGPYREPRSGIRRASLVLPGLFEVRTVDRPLLSAATMTESEPAGEVVAVCAIAAPGRFADSLRARGLQVGRSIVRPDHDRLSEGTLFAGIPKGQPVVTTAKDWVKLRERWDLNPEQVWIAPQEVAVAPSDEFAAWLRGRLDEIEAKGA